MCTYCGCRAIGLIGQFSTEHEAIVNATGVLRRAAGTGHAAAVQVAGLELAGMLDPHTRVEERSLFAKLSTDPEFAEHVERLSEEHEEINRRLRHIGR